MKNEYKRQGFFLSTDPLKLFSLALLLLFSVGTLKAQENNEGIKKVIQESEGSDNFGKSVSVYGNFAVVGAWTEDEKGAEAGAAYLFHRADEGKDDWALIKKLTASDGAAFNNFGTSVFIHKNEVAVSAPGNDDFTGAVYIFKKDQGGMDNWGETKKVIAHDGVEGDYFGNSIAMTDQYLLIGAYGNDQNGNKSGAAYLFKKGEIEWNELKKLSAKSNSANDQFGVSVALDNDRAVIGADNDNGVGSITIFAKAKGGMDNWGEQVQILASDRQRKARFGRSVAINGHYMAVGAPRTDGSSGTVYLFKESLGGTNNWGELKKMKAIDGDMNDQFGRHISLSENCLIVGSEGHFMKAGAVYMYKKEKGGMDNWGNTGKLMATDAEPGDLFGSSVAIFGQDVFVGAYKDDDMGSASGGIYLFKSNDKSVFASKGKK